MGPTSLAPILLLSALSYSHPVLGWLTKPPFPWSRHTFASGGQYRSRSDNADRVQRPSTRGNEADEVTAATEELQKSGYDREEVEEFLKRMINNFDSLSGVEKIDSLSVPKRNTLKASETRAQRQGGKRNNKETTEKPLGLQDFLNYIVENATELGKLEKLTVWKDRNFPSF